MRILGCGRHGSVYRYCCSGCVCCIQIPTCDARANHFCVSHGSSDDCGLEQKNFAPAAIFVTMHSRLQAAKFGRTRDQQKQCQKWARVHCSFLSRDLTVNVGSAMVGVDENTSPNSTKRFQSEKSHEVKRSRYQPPMKESSRTASINKKCREDRRPDVLETRH